jgi:arylsulfatase A-like enzyme
MAGLVLAAAAGAACSSDTASPHRALPNIVVLLADDQGWGDLSLHGNPAVSTPHIDAIGRSGAQFERFYVSPVCSPTRAEFLTGRYHPRGGVSGTSSGAERLNLDERTIAEVFKAAGYATGTFGKWHSGSQAPYHPNARGFDEFYGFTSGHWAHYYDPPLDHNGAFVTGRGYLPDDLTDRALAFLEANRDRPVFALLSYNTPHSPMQVPDAYWERARTRMLPPHRYSGEEEAEHTRAALAMMENLDWNVGRVLEALEQFGLASDTIVVYFTDNGPNGWRWNGDMKGRKGSLDEGGIRSPLLVRWPGRIAPGARVPQVAAAIDLLPTLAELAGVAVPDDRPLDGVSVAPLLFDPGRAWPDRHIFSFGLNTRAVSVRTQRYRLDAEDALFDMDADPGQRTDVSADHQALVSELRGAAARMAAEVGHGAPLPDRPFPVGHGPRTWLPVRDGVTHGGVVRSSRHPNDAYAMSWTSPAGAVTWDVDVLTAGEYDVEVLYAVPAGDTGATVQLSFLDQRVSARVTEAHDPPLVGQAEDRTPRTESYTKAFRPFPLGRIRLASQRGELMLSAPVIPGAQAWEVSGVVLTRR